MTLELDDTCQIIAGPDRTGSEALAPGTVLLGGQYRIERYLGSGGFAITYLARDSLDRMVVIKECFPESLCGRSSERVHARSSGHSEDFRSLVGMFLREAHSIAKLNHPNIVGVHQVFEDNDTAYMALDRIKGQDLLGLIEDGLAPTRPAEVRRMLRMLLGAIATVHREDMLHRDISPDNILIDANGSPILIDFGAARQKASKKSRAVSALLVVKDGYSPQEFYLAGTAQGPSSDLYSLAATFVHLITGDAPPDSQTRLAALAAKRTDPYQPLVGRIAGFDRTFLAAIDKAMNIFPAERIQTAADWLALISAPSDTPVPAQQPQQGPCLKDVVSKLVTEVQEGLAADKATEAVPAAIVEEKPQKVWEYLSPEEPETKAEIELPVETGDTRVPARPGRLRRIGQLLARLTARSDDEDFQYIPEPRRRSRGKPLLAAFTIVAALAILSNPSLALNDLGRSIMAADVNFGDLADIGKSLGHRANRILAELQ